METGDGNVPPIFFLGQKIGPAVFLGSSQCRRSNKFSKNSPRRPVIFRLGHYYSFYSRVRGALRFLNLIPGPGSTFENRVPGFS